MDPLAYSGLMPKIFVGNYGVESMLNITAPDMAWEFLFVSRCLAFLLPFSYHHSLFLIPTELLSSFRSFIPDDACLSLDMCVGCHFWGGRHQG